MSLESFRQYCKKSKFYYFNSVEDYNKKVDWNGKDVSKIKFERGLVDDRKYPPCLFSAYGTDIS